MASGRPQVGLRMASGRPQNGLRIASRWPQDALKYVGLRWASGWPQVSLRWASGWPRDVHRVHRQRGPARRTHGLHQADRVGRPFLTAPFPTKRPRLSPRNPPKPIKLYTQTRQNPPPIKPNPTPTNNCQRKGVFRKGVPTHDSSA